MTESLKEVIGLLKENNLTLSNKEQDSYSLPNKHFGSNFYLGKIMEEHNYSTVHLNSWKEYKLFVEQFSENWAFRGQADAQWVLNNAIARTSFIHFHKGIESEFVAEFQRGLETSL